MARVTGRGLRKAYGATEILHGLDLDEVAVLVGPSGCGTSTLLRMVAGDNRIGERVVNDLAPGAHDMVFPDKVRLFDPETERRL